ncbi:MAG: D-glycero-beta-D-manno-heptose 1-phosphate adenylyltransferase [Bacteroidetes bacterium]|jgi:rfaE bifunctional protein nucleotidyltransferase chain/domain|nr:D-glycero-beta-D-manno-heptose 1-phosphate adenylyltransferase [Bacteroidota bacterium]MBT6686087.1 D-glycero-beta-D-manno-heptose 1-phosphate adenylyltransferase [Bacteroidota bacterium]MBT7142020.1 D-glycero-beta-D-manno-heptose 1-phosphate adenylyltransferase [Bacteroidota bacterium]MBT7493594.1 D-glycero-beta-D-manno-heptose 1-phosphate adenylyltransferase [Bacteroidota bacterium]
MQKLQNIKAKILTETTLISKLNYWRFKEKKIVFTNGCFDIIHRGHIEYLAQAADLGDVLIIGLNTDNSVRKLKGENRPVQEQNSRALILAAMSFVSNIILFDEQTPYELIKLVQPDILVKGSDYKIEDIVGYDILKAKGGKVETIDFVEGFSTTEIFSRISL